MCIRLQPEGVEETKEKKRADECDMLCTPSFACREVTAALRIVFLALSSPDVGTRTQGVHEEGSIPKGRGCVWVGDRDILPLGSA